VKHACEGQNNGAATVLASGGTAPYSYRWSNGFNTATINNLAPGLYSVTSSDSAGCESIDEIIIEDAPSCIDASISLTKMTNGIDDDVVSAPVIIIIPGSSQTVQWDYVVTNTGNVDLTNVQVTDNIEGYICTIPFLEAGQSQTCSKTGIAAPGFYHNIGIASGTPTDSDGVDYPPVATQDTSSYVGAFMNVEKTADATCVCPGEEVEFTLTVRLVGGAPGIQLGNLTLTDTHLPYALDVNSAEFVSASDTNGNGFIDFVDSDGDGISDEEFVFKYTLVIDETITNTAMDMGRIYYDGVPVGMSMNSSSVTVTAADVCCSNVSCGIEFMPGSITSSACGMENGSIIQSLTGGQEPLTFNWSNGATTQNLSNVPAGTYTVEVKDATGCIEINAYVIESSNCGNIGSIVWDDINYDGIQDFGLGIGGAQLQLIDATTGLVIANTFTDANGEYLFENVNPGDYFIKVVQLPMGYESYIPTFANMTNADEDSNLNYTNYDWTTATFNFAGPEDDLSHDMGFYQGNQIGNEVWFDDDGLVKNGKDAGDIGVSGVEVRLIDANTGDILETTFTDSFGKYLFQNIPAGEYFVEFIAPATMTFVESDALPGDDETDSDAVVSLTDSQSGRSHRITVTTGMVNNTIDAGLKKSTTLAVSDVELDGRWDAENEMNVLDWTTLTEVNSDFFAVERSINSVDDFVEMGQVTAATNSSESLDYFYNDTNVTTSGTYYYRLRMVDLDGEFEYSNIVAIQVEFVKLDNQEISLDVYPNPVLNQINIDLVTEFDSKIEGGVYDAIGQLIKKLDADHVPAGKTTMKLDVSEIPSGTYLLRMQVGRQVIFEKITKAE